MKECGFGWNFGPYLSWPPFNRHHSQQWNHCKECAWLHTEDNLIVSCCENGDQAAVWVSRVERWVQPDLLPSVAWVAPHHLSALMFLSLEPKQMLCGEFAQDVVENWMNFVLCGPCHLVGEGWGGGLVNNRALLRTVGWFYDNMGVVQVANIRTRPLDSAEHSFINLLLPGGSFKTWTKK